ncbi:hypothetical protein PoB_004983300 [Plakobranchus ocellatus]|uniref:Uncharacterized protein n=1 Tax=Plakobranchus ocellatus TaxID=259542 RepID=A0AAV4BVT0_9GAST|nr:hypothetical protein PoB_004983300 [Plakobranchus ocellatus]
MQWGEKGGKGRDRRSRNECNGTLQSCPTLVKRWWHSGLRIRPGICMDSSVADSSPILAPWTDLGSESLKSSFLGGWLYKIIQIELNPILVVAGD